MTIYLIDDVTVVKQCKQMMKLGMECTSLYWSKTIKDIPDEVLKALNIVRNYSDEWLSSVCNEHTKHCELTEEEETILFMAIRQSKILKEILGSGVVFSGEQAKQVQIELFHFNGIEKILDAIQSGKNLILL